MELPNIFGIADDFLIVGYDSNGTDHDKLPWQVLQICGKKNMKLKKDKCHFRCIYYWVVELCKIFMAPQIILT